MTEPWIEADGAVYTRFVQGAWHRLPLPGKLRGMAHFTWPDPDHSVWYRQCSAYLTASGFKPDIIVGSYSPPAMFLIAKKLARRFNVPWIADYRDIWIELFDRSLGTRLKYSIQRRRLRTAAGITAASEGVVDALREQLSPLDKPIRLIYNGAELIENVEPDPADAKAVTAFQEISSRYPVVLTYTGTLYPPQQIELLLKAVAEFNERQGRACAIVLCGQHERARYAEWPFVHVLGPVSHQTALFFQRKSTAGFYPTWWPQKYTGFTGKIFEMILSGRPALIFCTPPPDLEALARRFKSLLIVREPEGLVKALEQLPQIEAKGAMNGDILAATKRHAVGELAKFMDEILASRKS